MRQLKREIDEIYKEIEAASEEDLEEFWQPYEQEYEKRKAKSEDDARAFLLFCLTSPKWKQTRRQVAKRLTAADKKAAQAINRRTKTGVKEAFLAETGKIIRDVKKYAERQELTLQGVFDIYDRKAEDWLKQTAATFPARKIPEKSATAWHEKQINKIMQSGISQGKPLQKLAGEIKTTCRMSDKASIRAARTMMTGARGAGHQMAYEAAEAAGVECEKEWMCTFDEHTRDSHAHMDGERVPVDEPFSNGCMHEGDPHGPAEEVWNCRCRTRLIIKGINEQVRYGAEYRRK